MRIGSTRTAVAFALVGIVGSLLVACQPVPSRIQAHGGVEQAWIIAQPHLAVALYDGHGKLVPTLVLGSNGKPVETSSRTTDANGALVFRYLTPGRGYTVRALHGSVPASNPFNVLNLTQPPPESFYRNQHLTAGFGSVASGYGYLTTRDGTNLSINVQLPGPADKGPYPTVVEYSGYDPSDPTTDLTSVSEILAHAMGFATVGVNIRGSGCSGGSMQVWEDTQFTDGYDAIETIAAQPWVLGHKVGMVGISYPAIAMTYVAGLRPPSLEAIAPMANYDDGFRDLLWPGGIQNSGFARAWIEERYAEAAGPVDAWVKQRIAGGDTICENDMRLRGQNLDLSKLIDANPYFPTELNLGHNYEAANYAKNIDVPMFMVGSWQDEQVGGHAPTLIKDLASDKHVYVTLTNGNHTEGLAVPEVLQRWLDFLQLYVAHEKPDTTALTALDQTVVPQIINAPVTPATLPMPKDPYQALPTYRAALAAFQAQPRVKLLFDVGGAPGIPAGLPEPGFTATASTYPVPSTQPTTWYLGPDQTLSTTAPTAPDGSDGTVDSYVSDPKARPSIDLVKGSTWDKLPDYDWTQPVPGKSLSYVSPPLTQDTVMVGSGSVDLWLKSSAADTDLQATLSEVRPDGKETLVQSGWLRASKRKLDDAASTELQPLQTQLETDASPLPAGQFTPVRLEIYPFGHAFRKGSRIRLTITAPGGDRSVWAFVNLPGTQDNSIARSVGMPSSVVLPVVPGISIPTPLPACPALRGQPCRTYVPPTS